MLNGLTINQLHIHNFFAYEDAIIPLYDSTIISGINNGVGKCLDKNTIIFTSDGQVKTIEQIYNKYKQSSIKISDTENIINVSNIYVPSFDGIKIKNMPIEYIYRQKINEPTITIKTQSGRKITSTLNHKFYRFNENNGGEWIKSYDLHIRDKIGIISNLPELINNYSSNIIEEVSNDKFIIKRKIEKNYTQKSIKTPSLSDPHIYELIGWMISEDNEIESSGTINFTQYDDTILDRFSKLCNICFDINSIPEYKNHNIRVNSISICEYLKSIGYEFGNKSRTKHFPDWIISAPLELMNTCLRSYFDGDGCFQDHNISISSASSILIHQIYYMLLRNNIISSYHEKYSGIKLGINEPYYELIISSVSNLKIFAEKIGFSIKYKMNNLLNYINITNNGSCSNYCVNLNSKLLKKIRSQLYLKSNQCGIYQGMISAIENRNSNLGRNNIKILFNCFINKINDFENILMKNIENTNDLRKYLKILNISLSEFYRKSKIILYKNNTLSENILNKAINELKKICENIKLLKPIIFKLYNDFNNILFDEIVDIIIENPKEQYVYDLHIPETNNFVSGFGILCHNTTIADSILYALTGKFLRNTKEENAIKYGTSEMIVELEGIYNNEDIIIKRSYDGKTHLEISKGNPKEEILNPKEFLTNIINETEFSTLIYINGHDMEYIINQGDIARSKLLDKMFGIDTIAKIIDAIKPNSYLKTHETLQDELNLKRKIYEETQKMLSNTNVEMYQNQLQDFRNERTDIIEELKIIKKSFNNIQKQKEEFDNYEKQKNIDLRELGKLDILLEQKSKISMLEESVKEYLLEGENIDKALERLKNQIDKQSHICNYESLFIDATQRIINHINKKKLCTCPICSNKINSLNKIIPNTEELKKMDDLKSKYYELSLIKQQIDDTHIDNIESKYTKLSERIYQYEIKKQSFDIDKYNELRNQQQLLENQITIYNKKIESIMNKIATVNDISKKSNYLIQLSKEIVEYEQKITNEYQKYIHARELKLSFNKLLSLLRTETLNKINPSIQVFIDMMTAHQKNEMPNKPLEFEVIIDTKQTKKNDLVIYKFVVKRFGEELAFDNLSTGQKAICILALLLSLLDLLHPDLNLVIFDEIHTSGIDQNANYELIDAITLIAKRLNILFIDRNIELNKLLHEKMLKNDVKSIIYNVSNNKNQSKIVSE